jgi:Domain of unknown function (DUF4293)
MIQRIQSVLLLVAAICSVLLFFFPVFTWDNGSDTSNGYTLSIWKTVEFKDGNTVELQKNQPLGIVNSMVIILTFGVILMFKTRLKQARYCHLLTLLQLALISMLLYEWDQVNAIVEEDNQWELSLGIAFLILPLALFLTSRYFILKDDELVKSANRLR